MIASELQLQNVQGWERLLGFVQLGLGYFLEWRLHRMETLWAACSSSFWPWQ